MAQKTVNPGQAIPSFAAGDVVRFKTGTHRPPDVIRVPINGVTFEFEAGVILDGRRVLGNLFYLNGGDGTKLVGLDPSSPPRLINAVKTVIYTSTADRFLIENIYTGYSGSDGASSGGKLDHGIYIDGGTGWRVVSFIAEKISGHGIQVYSGGGKVTTGTIDGFRAFGCGGDGLHFGNGSKDCVATRCDLHHNSHNGCRSYKGTGNKLDSPNWIYGNTRKAVEQNVPLALVEFTPSAPPVPGPNPEPPPEPEPEPEPSDPCQSVKDDLAAMTIKANTHAQKLEIANDRLSDIDLLAKPV